MAGVGVLVAQQLQLVLGVAAPRLGGSAGIGTRGGAEHDAVLFDLIVEGGAVQFAPTVTGVVE